MQTNVDICFSDLSGEVQDRVIQEVSEQMLVEIKEEGQKSKNREWNEPKPNTWQEAYVRTAAIEYQLWMNYERGGEETIEDEEWKAWLEDWIAEKAEAKIYQAMKYQSININI